MISGYANSTRLRGAKRVCFLCLGLNVLFLLIPQAVYPTLTTESV